MYRWRGLMTALILAWASLTGAECAWVLWQENELSIYGKQGRQAKWWDVVETYAARDACTQAQLRTWNVLVSQCDGGKCPGVQEVKKVSPSLVILTFKPDEEGFPGGASHRLLCMPDTIDPRDKQTPPPREQRPQFQRGKPR
jgi:hypothetical protein